MSRKFKVPLNLVGLTTDPGSATNGDLYFNTVSNKVRYYTQNTWQDLGAAAGGATVQVSTTIPATATEGKLWYDNDDAHLYVFDGTYWVEVSIGPVGPAGPTGAGVPIAGTTGQYLVKSSNNNYETTWSTLPAASLTSTDVSRLTGATSNLQTQINTLSTNLGNTLDDYVPVGDVGQPDGVASLNSSGTIPDAQLASNVTRDSNTQTFTNKSISISSGLTSVSGYDSITAFFGQSNIPVFQDGIDKGGRINISSVGVITQATPGAGYTPGLGIIGGGTRVIIGASGNILTGRLVDFNAALTDGDFATTSDVSTAIANLIDAAPGTLNTLNELAAAINDDASYAATITTALGNKLDSNYVTIGNTLLDGISGQTYGLIGTSAYLDVKNTNGYNKEIELDITAVEAKLVTDGFAKLASPTFTGTVILPNSTVTNSMLANSSITINGSAVSLGGSTTIAAGLSPVAVSTNITMVKNTRYFVDTTSDLTLTLPATPSLGDEIELYDAGNNAFNNDVIILRNGEKINGLTDNAALDINGFTVSFIYTGSTYGWRMK